MKRKVVSSTYSWETVFVTKRAEEEPEADFAGVTIKFPVICSTKW